MKTSLDTITNLAKRRGFVFPASDIYGGVAGLYDYGPYGVEMTNRIKAAWWKYYVRDVPNIFGLDSSIIQSPQLWEASGHVEGFNDPLVDCKNCKARHRADHLAGKDTNDLKELAKLLKGKKCPNCGKATLTEPRTFNMMFRTHLGPVEDNANIAYLRPETAGSIFTNFELVRESTRAKIPFGIAQIGKAFRNEISPRDWLFRVRELEQMEMQYFVNPVVGDKEYENLRKIDLKWFTDVLGLDKKKLKWHEHDEGERAHYAKTAHDIQYDYPSLGFKEVHGTHNRTDFDLSAHSKASGKDLAYFDAESAERYTPFVMESSTGVGRTFMAILADAYTEEKVKSETRVVLKLKAGFSPVDVAVLPLSKNDKLSPLAHEVYHQLIKETDLNIEYDETQSIGKRYRRQDEIGTPKCVTIDFDTLDDKSVTIRERDTMKQTRVKISDLLSELNAVKK